MREIFSFDGMERKVFVFFGALALLTVLGPFGTYEEFGFWERFVYWVAIMVAIGFFMHVIVKVAMHTQVLGRAGQLIRIAIGCVIAGLPGAAVVIFDDILFRDEPLTPEELPLIWAQVTMIGFAISLVEFVDWRRNSEDDAPPVRTRFHERLNPDLGPIISLSMQDHYVEVTCENGTEMILIRMSDAVAELEGFGRHANTPLPLGRTGFNCVRDTGWSKNHRRA